MIVVCARVGSAGGVVLLTCLVLWLLLWCAGVYWDCHVLSVVAGSAPVINGRVATLACVPSSQ